MRDIKYRAWDNKMNCYGHGCRNQLTDRDNKELYMSDTAIGFKKIDEHKQDTALNFYKCSWREIVNSDRFTTEQFTGLKDIDGVEIYEGDIIKSESGVATIDGKETVEISVSTYSIYFNEGLHYKKCITHSRLKHRIGKSEAIHYPDILNKYNKVIGNIHEKNKN